MFLLLWPALALQAATTVTHVAAGRGYSLFIKSDGSLWGAGDNFWGQLGDGAQNAAYTPEEIVSNDVVVIAAGAFDSLFVKSDGSLWGMGDNYAGQLGDGSFNSTNKPELIVSNNVVAVAAGDRYSLFIQYDGSLWGMGNNEWGQLGIGTYSKSPPYGINQPVEIVSNDVVAVAAGWDYSLFLKTDGSLWGMGDNYFGQLGGTNYSTDKPVEIVSSNVVAMAAGGYANGDYSLFVKSDGSLWGMGDNYFGQLGSAGGNTPEEIVSNGVVAVAAGGAYSLFVKSDGSLWGMGENGDGQLGDGTNADVNTPEEIVSSGVVAVSAEGGGISTATCSQCIVTNLAAHSLFIKADGSLWAMGANDAGQLGDGFGENSSVPEQIVPVPQPALARPMLAANVTALTVTDTAAGDSYSLFVKSDGSLWGMGQNSSGQLGVVTLDTAYVPEQIVSSNIVAAATGGYYGEVLSAGGTVERVGFDSLFVKSDGSLWGMGDNYFGQLGDGTTSAAHAPEEIVSNNVVAVASGGGHNLFLKSDGSLWAMGANDAGQLGDGTFNSTNEPQEIVSNNVIAVAGGESWPDPAAGHTLFLKTDGSLWGMGDNGYGELGNVGGNTPEEIVSNNVVAVATGWFHSLFLKSDGSLWAMGDNEWGQLGGGTTNGVHTPEEIVSNNVVVIAAGAFNSLFVKSDGSLWGMGYNADGQLGDGTTNDVLTPEEIVSNSVVTISAGWYHSLFIKSDGSLWGMGDNSAGELGNGSSSSLVPEKLAGGPWLRGTCFAGGTYRLLSSTDAALPVSQWTPVWTNTIAHRGPNNFSAPLPDDLLSRDPQRFYLLESR